LKAGSRMYTSGISGCAAARSGDRASIGMAEEGSRLEGGRLALE
jgi:hypothetical protein